MFEDEYNVTRLSLFSGQSETPGQIPGHGIGVTGVRAFEDLPG